MLDEFVDARVLVIDDEPSNLVLLERLLTRRGLRRIDVESDPSRAVAGLDGLAPDIVLLDLHMPGMHGHDVLAAIRRWAAGAYLPVIVLTADTTPAALEESLSRGATDFLTKPFNATEIVLRIRNLLQTRELYRSLTAHVRESDARLDAWTGQEAEALRTLEEARRRVGAVLAAGGPRMVFQPVVDMNDRSTVGYEALSRFAAGTPDPATWFDVADGAGLGADLEMAAATAAVSAAAGLPDPGFVAVNLSPATVVSGRLDDLDAGAVPLVIELTERVPVEDYEAVNSALAPLRERGARLALDDAGAGYAGLRHLLHLHPDVVKLDISLVASIDTDPVRRALAAALLSFARDIGARVIAEGVETKAQAAALGDLGVSWAQGWHYGRPAPAAAW